MDTYNVKRDVDEALTGLRIALRASSEHLIERSAWKLVAALEKAEKFAAATEPERTPETVLRAMLRAYEAAALDAAVAWAPSCTPDTWLPLSVATPAACASQVRLALALATVGRDPLDVLSVTVGRDYEARLAGTRPLNAPPLEV